jgi:superfamily I DNA/RNA helicase
MTLEFMAKLSTDISDLKDKIRMIFSDDLFGIVLSTVHKSKGLEADRVFIARPDKMPLPTKKAWQYQQEMNLKYVAITRAKYELVFDHKWTDEEEGANLNIEEE